MRYNKIYRAYCILPRNYSHIDFSKRNNRVPRNQSRIVLVNDIVFVTIGFQRNVDGNIDGKKRSV